MPEGQVLEINGNGAMSSSIGEEQSAEDPEKDFESRKRKGNDGEETPSKKSRTDSPPSQESADGAPVVLEISESASGVDGTGNSQDSVADLEESNSVSVEISAPQKRKRRFSGDDDAESDSDVVALDDDDDVEDPDEGGEAEDEEEIDSDDDDGEVGMRNTAEGRDGHEVYDLTDEDDEVDGDPGDSNPRPLIIPDWPHAHHCVLVIRLRRPFYIVGNYEVQCVKGTVDVMGVTLSPTSGFSDFVPVYSSRIYGAIPIEINSVEPEDKTVLEKLQTKEFVCRRQDVVLILRRLQNSLTQHVQNYAPNALGLSRHLVSAGEATYANLNFINCIGLYENQKSFFKECGLRLLDLDLDFLRTAVFGNGTPGDDIGVVLACGGKNTGKSTVLRCLLNCVLSAKGKSPILYMDCDPGQSEFSVSGSVSLVEVTKPVLGPAFTHHVRPVGAYFLGHMNIVSCPDEYLRAIEKLMELKKSKTEYENSPVFINTMGWTRGMGVDLLVEVMRLVKPKVVIQLQSKTDTHNLPTMTCDFISSYSSSLTFKPMRKPEKTATGENGGSLNDSGEMPYDFQLIHFRSGAESDPNMRSYEGFRAPFTRDLMTLAYFSQMQPGIAQPSPLTTVVPYKVPWRSIAIQSTHSSIPTRDVLNLVVGNLVALCRADSADMIAPKDPSHPKMLKLGALPSCLGFGYVRAVDPVEKLFYVITPLLPKRLHDVNCFSVGVLAMPLCILDESPHFFAVSPGEILAPSRGENFRPSLQRGVVPRTFKKR